MTLEAGRTLGHYEILAVLGAGGMGEVYRARDGRLGRDVAIKLLLEEVASDPDRLARFEREARVLASLNHPRVATLHGFESDGNTRFLVMELVEGETLADRIARGPIPIAEAISIFIQIADGLEAAHEKGIVHRDLKPANIKIAGDEQPQVKILDFGLAKALAPQEAASGNDPALSASPTLTLAATMRGEILGTAAYMSPEQASGKTVDKRTDVWAFGVCLYEALTGHRAFQGEDAPNTLAAVLRDEIDLSRLPADCPAALRRGLERCLVRNRAHRLHDIGDMRLELEAAGSEDAGAVGPTGAASGGRAPWSRRSLVLGGAVGAAGLALGLFGSDFLGSRTSEPAISSTRSVERYILASDDQRDLGQAISPNGSRVAYATVAGLWIRELDRLEPRLLDGTAGASAPFWSPDSEWVGYQLGSVLWKAHVGRSETAKICDLPLGLIESPSWGEDASILFVAGAFGFASRVMRVAAEGGDAQVAFEPDRAAGERRFWGVHRLPEGRGTVIGLQSAGAGEGIQIRDGEGRVVSSGPSVVEAQSFAYSSSGYLLYSSDSMTPSQLWAIRFSLERLELMGDPFRVSRGAHDPSVAADGTLVYRRREPRPQRLLWVSRAGEPLEHAGTSQTWIGDPSASRDGRQVAFVSSTGDKLEADLFVQGAGRANPIRLTIGEVLNHPAFSPDGDRITYVDSGADQLASVVLQGTGAGEPEPLLGGGQPGWAPHWSSDGRYLVFYRIHPATDRDLWYLDVETGGEPVPYLEGPRDQLFPRLSPDDRYLAYQSDERDQWQIYVETFPERTRRWLVSENDGRHPRWSPRGDELFFVSGDDLMSAHVTLAPAFAVGSVRRLFGGADVGARLSLDSYLTQFYYDVGPGAERFLVVEGLEMGRRDIVLVRNWDLELERLAASE